MNEVILKIFNTGIIDEGVNDALKTSIKFGAILAPLFYIGNITWNFAITTLKNFGTRPTMMFDRMELIRASFLWFILTAGYVPIFGSIAKLGDTLGRYSISKNTSVAEGKERLTENYTRQLESETEAAKDENSQQSPPQQDENSKPSGFWDIIRGGWNTFVLLLSGAAWALLSVIVRTIVLAFALILAKIFYVIGPIVIAFSILPVFKDKFSQWAGVYLNCLCVPFTMNLLDTIIFSIVGKTWQTDSYASPYSITIFGVIMSICYALSFWITSFYCGSSGAAKVVSTFVTTATSAANHVLSSSAAASSRSEQSKQNSNIIEDKSQQPPNNQEKTP